MKLDAPHVQFFVPESHDVPFAADGSRFEAFREAVRVDYPRMVPSHAYLTGESRKNRVVGYDRDAALYAVINAL